MYHRCQHTNTPVGLWSMLERKEHPHLLGLAPTASPQEPQSSSQGPRRALPLLRRPSPDAIVFQVAVLPSCYICVCEIGRKNGV